MFFGTTPQIVSQFIYSELQRIKPKRVFVPFAGNFVVEQLTGLYDKNCELHSTDVSIYSRAIGHGLTNIESEIKLKSEVLEQFPYFNDKTSPIEIAAQVIFFSEVAKNLKKDKLPYYQSLNQYANQNIEFLFTKIMTQLKNFKNNLPDKFKFYGLDACEIISNADSGDFIFYDPPVILGDYEKMFKALEGCFEFENPPYTEMNDEIKANHLQEFCNKGITAFYRTNNPIEIVPDRYEHVFKFQYKWHGSYCIYSNANSTNKFVGWFEPLKESPGNYKLIDSGYDITENSKVTIERTSGKIANHYRMMWVKKAEMTDGGYPFLIFLDNLLIGLVQIESGLKFGMHKASIFSDPPAPTSKYKRLSKLILYLCLTDEFLKQFNDVTLWEHDSFTTRVFTNEPVSMKYRSLFELTNREEVKEGNHKYKLIYHSKKLLPDFQTAIKEFLKKDGKQLEQS